MINIYPCVIYKVYVVVVYEPGVVLTGKYSFLNTEKQKYHFKKYFIKPI